MQSELNGEPLIYCVCQHSLQHIQYWLQTMQTNKSNICLINWTSHQVVQINRNSRDQLHIHHS